MELSNGIIHVNHHDIKVWREINISNFYSAKLMSFFELAKKKLKMLIKKKGALSSADPFFAFLPWI
jgi:hypothetical protein